MPSAPPFALDSRTWRDGMVLNSNEQKPILFFVHREIVMCALKDPNSAKADSDLSQNLALVNRPRLVRKFNPAKVKLKLGALNLIGQKVQFANRLIVSSVDEGKVGVQPPATLYFVKIGAEIRQGGSANIEVGDNNKHHHRLGIERRRFSNRRAESGNRWVLCHH